MASHDYTETFADPTTEADDYGDYDVYRDENGSRDKKARSHHAGARHFLVLLLALAFVVASSFFAFRTFSQGRAARQTVVNGATLPVRIQQALKRDPRAFGGLTLPHDVDECATFGEQPIAGRKISTQAESALSPTIRSRARTCRETHEPQEALAWLVERNQQSRFAGQAPATETVKVPVPGSPDQFLSVTRLRAAGQLSSDNLKPRPVVICVSGLAVTQSACRASVGQQLARAGYDVVLFDPRGIAPGAASSGSTTTMSAKTEAQDALTVTQWLRNQSDVNSQQITLLGQSQGGLAALIALHEQPKWYARAVFEYPAFMLPHLVRYVFQDKALIPERVTQFGVTLSRQYATDIWDVDANRWLAQIPVPTLIVQGMDDSVVPPEVSYRAVGEIPESQLVLLPGQPHGFNEDGTLLACARVVSFIDNS